MAPTAASPRPIVGILLAAGRGTRFGGDKLLHPLDDGTPMALLCARKLRRSCDHVVTVVSSGAVARRMQEEGLDIVTDGGSFNGVGHSLAAGVRATREAAGWIVALGDMPFIELATYHCIAAALREGASIAVPEYEGRTGHPMGFARRWRDQLCALTGDNGARTLVRGARAQVHRCEVGDPGIYHDVDTVADLSASPSGWAALD